MNKYAALLVLLYVSAPGDIDLTAQETVRLDRIEYSTVDGFTADRYGDLLRPGTNRVRLEPGVYHFRTLHDARLHVVQPGAVTVAASDRDGKDPWPDPPPPPPPGSVAAA